MCKEDLLFVPVSTYQRHFLYNIHILFINLLRNYVNADDVILMSMLVTDVRATGRDLFGCNNNEILDG